MKQHRAFTEKQKKLLSGGAIVILSCCPRRWPGSRAVPWSVSPGEPEAFRQWVAGHGVWGMAAYAEAWCFCRCWWPSSPANRWRSREATPSAPCGGHGAVPAGLDPGQCGGVRRGAEMGYPAGGGVLPQGEAGKAVLSAHVPKRTALLWLVFTVPGTPQGPAVLLCGPHGPELVFLAADRLRGPHPSIVTSTVGGDALGMQNYQFAVVTFLATLVIAGVGLLIYRQGLPPPRRPPRLCRQ